MPFIFRPTILHPPSYLLDDPASAAVEHALAAGPLARPPTTVESLDRRPPASPNTHSVQSWKTELLPRNSLYSIWGACRSRTNGDGARDEGCTLLIYC
jgi:hypothetical protein